MYNNIIEMWPRRALKGPQIHDSRKKANSGEIRKKNSRFQSSM